MLFNSKSFSINVEIREERKMKKIFLILGFLIAFIFLGLNVTAKANQLHTITFEKNNESYNIILDTDSISKVSRKVLSDNEIVLQLSGITSSDTVNALYKGAGTIDNLIIENAGLNKLKVYVSAPNIKSSSVIMNPADGAQTLVGESFPVDKAIWTFFVLAVLGVVAKRAIKRTNEDNSLLIKKDIKDREIALYRQYRRSMDEGTSLPLKNPNMPNILKKIDRKIDERLSLLTK